MENQLEAPSNLNGPSGSLSNQLSRQETQQNVALTINSDNIDEEKVNIHFTEIFDELYNIGENNLKWGEIGSTTKGDSSIIKLIRDDGVEGFIQLSKIGESRVMAIYWHDYSILLIKKNGKFYYNHNGTVTTPKDVLEKYLPIFKSIQNQVKDSNEHDKVKVTIQGVDPFRKIANKGKSGGSFWNKVLSYFK